MRRAVPALASPTGASPSALLGQRILPSPALQRRPARPPPSPATPRTHAGDKRLQGHLQFLLSNLGYEHESGRGAALDLLTTMLAKFPEQLVAGWAEVVSAVFCFLSSWVWDTGHGLRVLELDDREGKGSEWARR